MTRTTKKKTVKKKNRQYWDNEVVGAAMRKYRLAHTVTSTSIPGQTKLQRDIVLKNEDDHAEMQKLYRTVIYPAHKRLTRHYLAYKNIDKDHREAMTEDILTYLYEVMMLWWDPHKSTSAYSYFASAISTNISHFYSGKMACSPQWTAEKDSEFVIRDIDVGPEGVEEAKANLAKEMQSLDMREGVDFEIKSYYGDKKVKAAQYKRTQRHHLDDDDDIAEGFTHSIWSEICLQTLSEYIPDVVIAQKYHKLAFAVLEVLKEVIDGTWRSGTGSRLRFWLLSRVQLEVGWAVTQHDLKLTFFVLRKAFEYYLEDFPLDGETEYGECGLIVGIKD